MKYEMYGLIHKVAKKVFRKNNDLPRNVKLVSFPLIMSKQGKFNIKNAAFINEFDELPMDVELSKVYPVENYVNVELDQKYPKSFVRKHVSIRKSSTLDQAKELWKTFVKSSTIPPGYRNAGFHYAGFIQECQEWCLPSWIWTSAAIARYYCKIGQIVDAERIGNLFLVQQKECGGWVVRNDYSQSGVSPQLAPNDSCYIASNALLELYRFTKKEKYLNAAIKTADWTVKTARPDGLVFFAYDTRSKKWIKNKNIVDTGFTAKLFAELYEITGNIRYKQFLEKFTNAYINAFYMSNKKCFSTAIDEKDRQFGGAFGRGQGWALEGLIPAYRVLRSDLVKKVIENTINTLLHMQNKNGSWSYNLLRPLMGEDCKAVPVIAKSLLDWSNLNEKRQDLIVAAHNALNWCVRQTVVNGIGKGGIFSYTVEGAVVHHYYTNTAFVYGSSYALEVAKMLEGFNR